LKEEETPRLPNTVRRARLKLGLSRRLEIGARSGAGRSRAWLISYLPFLLFFTYLVVGNFVLILPAVYEYLVSPWTHWNALAAAALIGFFGGRADVVGTILSSGSATLDIRNGCNAVHAVLILSCAFLASPVRWRLRLIGVVLGAGVIFGFNIIRLVILLVVARYLPNQLELFHVYVLQTLVLLFVFSTYLVWTKFVGRQD